MTFVGAINKQTNILDLTAIKQLRKIAQSLHHKRLLSFLAHDFGFVSCCLQRDIDIVTTKQPSHFSSVKFLSAQNLEQEQKSASLFRNFDEASPTSCTIRSGYFNLEPIGRFRSQCKLSSPNIEEVRRLTI